MAGKKKDALAKSGSSEIEVPDFIPESPEGLENVTGGDLVVPRLLLMQALSPQVTQGTMSVGDIVNGLTEEVWVELGDHEEFIPVYHYKEWILWASRDSGLGILDRSTDPRSELAMSSQRGEKDETGKFKVTEYHNFIAIFRKHGFHKPVVIPCCRTNHKNGRRLLGLAKYRGNYPLYAGVYTLAAESETNRNNQTYQVWHFENAGWVDEEELKAAKAVYDMLRSVNWRASEATPEEPTDEGPVEGEEEV